MCDLPARRHAQESRPDHQGRSMSASYTSISPDKLFRLVGTAAAPTLIDMRIEEEFSADPRLIPGAALASRRPGLGVPPDGPVRRRGLSQRQEAQRGDRGLAPLLQRRRREPRKWSSRLEGSEPSDGAGRQDSQARRAWPHGVGHASLSRMFDHDLEQLNAGLQLYDAFYRWCRDATRELHNRQVRSKA